MSVDENIKDIKAFLTNNSANKITVTSTNFTIFNNPDKRKIKNRIKQLTAKMEVEVEDFAFEDFQKKNS